MMFCAGIIFLRVEQGAVSRSIRNKDHVSEQNALLNKKNEDLKAIKKQLQQDEEE